MSTEKVVLGLDVGVSSIGWGLVKLQEEQYPSETPDGQPDTKQKIVGGEIIKTGVRTFQIPEDRQKKSLALIRGSARRTRRTIKRKVQRLNRLIKLAKEFKLIGDDFNRDEILIPKKGDKEIAWDIWLIRKQALERKLNDVELFRVLYHIAKHRGSYFHTKAEFLPEEEEKELNKNKKKEKEESKEEKVKGEVKKALYKIQKLLKDSKYKTIGALFYETFKQTNDKGSNRKRNAPDKYEHSIRRELLRDEIAVIFKQQQEFNNPKTNPEFAKRYIDEILMYEEEIDEDKMREMMSDCEFVPSEKCAPKESYTSERFTLFNRLNSLAIRDGNDKNSLKPLDNDQREKIIALAYENAGGITFAQIRTELGLEEQPHLTFNLCSYKEKNPEYNKKIVCEIKNSQLQFEEKHRLPIVNIDTGEVSTLDKEIKDIFTKKFNPKYKKGIYVYYSDIRKQLNLSNNFRFANLDGYTKSISELEREYNNKKKKNKKLFNGQAEYIKQFEDDDTFVKLSGYHKIRKAIEKYCGEEKWRQISGDTEKCGELLDTTAMALTYCKSDKTRTEYLQKNDITDQSIIDAALTVDMSGLANFSKEALSNLLKYMESKDRLLFNDAKEKCEYGKKEYEKQALLKSYKGPFEKNPVVARVISQTRKVINAILRECKDKYTIDQIHIEIATELAKSKEQKDEISRGQRRYKDEKEAAEERCKKWNINPDEGQNLLMFRLAEQQGNECPYTGKKIMFEPTTGDNAVFVLDCEIDHIIPMSRSFNDSLNNKVLCDQKANQDKQDRIPFEWFGSNIEKWSQFENRVKRMYGMPYPKKKNLLRKSWTDEDKEKFLTRNLNDTRYAARHIADYLRKYFDFSKSKVETKDENRIQVRSGGITAFLRHIWGLNKDREANDLHHAVDALVVACSTYGHVFLVSNLAKEIERKGKSWFKQFDFLREKFKPWKNIREDIIKEVEKIFVSRMPRHKVTAPAHKDGVFSLKDVPLKNRVVKVHKRKDKTGKEVFTGYAEMGDMVRADVFTDEDGKNYVVPIYAVDMFSKKPLPDKYVPDDRNLPYDKWPSATDKKLTFKFSLFKDDLVRIIIENRKNVDDKVYYVSFFEAATANVNVKNIDGSIFPDKKDAKDPYTKKICYRPKRKTGKCVLKKYSVDMLGNFKEIKQEKRLGNDRVKRVKKPKKNG